MPLGRNSTAGRTARQDDSAAAKVVDNSVHEGNLVKIKKPTFISMVGLPANQTAFAVVREDNKGKPMNSAIVRRTRRSADPNPVLRLTFPEGYDELSVAEALKNYGMTGYKVESTDGVYVATRSDLKSISPDETMQIRLSEDGLVAVVSRQDSATATGKSALTVAQIEFEGDKYTLEEVQRWVTENKVDGTVQEPANAGESYVVRRSDIPENEETRRMVLEDGVTAVVMRSDAVNIPDGMVAVVNETAYGNWGWGQLDFAAAMGDKEFSEAMRSSIYTLEDVLRNIVIYSALPLDVRKELANRALAQFGEYIGNVMDSLPRQLLVSVVRSAKPQLEKQMTQQQQGGSNGSAASNTPTTPTQAPTTAALTRDDVKAMLKEMTPELVVALRDALAAAPKVEPATPAATTTTAEPAKTETLTRADLASAFGEAIKPLVDTVKELQGTTVVRSAADNDQANQNGGDDKNKPKDVFRGAFSGLRTVPKRA